MTTAVLDLPTIGERALPWAGITTGSVATGNGLATSEDLLQEAGLNWNVVKRPLLRQMTDGSTPQSPGDYEIYRDDDETKIGVVKSHYQPFHNRDAFAFGDPLVADGLARWTDAGLQGNGYRVFMVMQLTNSFTVLGEDQVTLYLFLRTSHDGSTAVSGYVTPIRFFCTNQVNLITKTAENSFTFKHTTNLAKRIAQAHESFATTVAYRERFTSLVERLVATPVHAATASSLIGSVIPENRSRRGSVIADILTTYDSSLTVAPYHGTAYGLLNALTEYMDHGKPQRSGNARFQSIMFSEGAKARRDLVDRLLTLG
jgi:phage/plasmid-like protein (TIGR03299 family)